MGVFSYAGTLPPGSPTFVGREMELTHIARLCRGEVEKYIILLGARQSGKTSLFYQLDTHLDNHAQVIPINLQGLPNADSTAMFYYIAQKLASELVALPFDPENHTHEPNDTVEEMADELTQVHDEIPTTDNIRSAPGLKQLLCDLSPQRTIVVTIDEIGAVQPQAAQDLANALRSFHQDRWRDRYAALRRYVFILAGGIELYHLAATHVSTLYNISDRLYLGDLSHDESDELLTKGFGELGIEQSSIEALNDRIFYYACGHPYLTQRLGGFVEETLQAQDRVPTENEIVKMAFDLAGDDTNVVSLINGLQKEDLWTEAKQLVYGEPIPFIRTASVPCRLELLGLIRNEDGNCAVRNPIYEETIRLGEAKAPEQEWGEPSLKDIQPGLEDAHAYEQCVFEILCRCFAGQLAYPQRESKTGSGHERRDIMFFNVSSHPFWQMVGREHHAVHIVFECKNTKDPPEYDHVNQLGAYLGKPLGSFGVIVSRLLPKDNVIGKARTMFNRDEKVILFLNDQDLIRMVQLHTQRKDPTDVIMGKYAEFTRKLE